MQSVVLAARSDRKGLGCSGVPPVFGIRETMRLKAAKKYWRVHNVATGIARFNSQHAK